MTPEPFHPVIHGMLLTGDKPLYLTAQITGGHGFSSRDQRHADLVAAEQDRREVPRAIPRGARREDAAVSSAHDHVVHGEDPWLPKVDAELRNLSRNGVARVPRN